MNFNILEQEDLTNLLDELENLKNLVVEYKSPRQKEWLTEKEAMEYLQISKSTIQRYRRDGFLDFSQFQNKIYFKLQDILEFLESNYSGSEHTFVSSKTAEI